MKRSRMRKCIVAAVAAAGLAVCGDALAQQRVNNGNAIDANPRVGSNSNDAVRTVDPGVTGNQIITGNVTNLRAFQGFVPYRDPRAFTGPYAGESSDRFIKNSSAPPAPYQPSTPPNQAEAFYGRGLATPPPAGYTELGATGTYSRPAIPQTPKTIGSQPGDVRLNIPAESLSAPSLDTGNFMLEGFNSQLREPTLMTGSPLYGVRQWRPGEMLYKPQEREKTEDKTATNRDAKAPANPLLPSDKPIDTDKTGIPELNLTSSAMKPSLLSGRIDSAPLSDELKTTPQVQVTRRVRPPAEQSSQYAQMREQLEHLYGKQLGDNPQAFKDILQKLKLQQSDLDELAGLKKSSTTQPTRSLAMRELSEIGREMGAVGGKGQPGEARPQPVEIKSLATGIKNETLSQALSRAESQMRSGKFIQAMAEYDAADAISPMNPLVWLGRAHAELGAGYYGRAAAHLRHALSLDPTLLMGRYDLGQMIGPDRLEFLMGDLKQIATRDKAGSEPVLLLAYIAYNTGHPDEASRWLQEAERRAGGEDRVIRTIRAHWRLPAK